MGCDIHVHVEIKINGWWHHYNHPRVERRYSLFGKMAGVRDESQKPLSPPKGLPENVTFMTWYDATKNWDGGYHSASYLDLAEIGALHDWWEEQEFIRPATNHRIWFEDQCRGLFIANLTELSICAMMIVPCPGRSFYAHRQDG